MARLRMPARFAVAVMLLIAPLRTAPQTAKDRIELNRFNPNCRAVAVVDGPHEDGCWKDEDFTGISSIDLPNALKPTEECPSELAVFSRDRALYLGSLAGQDTAGETHRVDLKQAIEVPLAIWITRPDNDKAEKEARDDVANTAFLFSASHSGIAPIEGHLTHVSAVRGPFAGLKDCTANSCCDGLEEILGEGDQWHKPNRLNVYYLDTAKTKSFQCRLVRQGNVIGMTKRGRTPSSLAHEMGHALGLADNAANDSKEFAERNVMWTRQRDGLRDRFSLGQVFRMNILPSSRLNGNGHRNGEVTRTCDAGTDCPDVEDFDWSPLCTSSENQK